MKEENIRYILENIISKAKYNSQTDKYEIKESDYIDLNLSTNKMKLLKSICENLDIELEYKGYTRMLLPAIENEHLFQEYNEIKLKLEKDPTSLELEQKRIQIRNKIVIDNLDLVKSIFERRIDKINDMPEKEDIIQLGYETLLNYLDNNYLYKGDFKDSISKILLLYTTRKLISSEIGISYSKKQLMTILTEKTTDLIEIESLSRILNLKDKRIEELLVLEELLSPISFDELIESLDLELDNSKSPLYDDSFEREMINKYSKQEMIRKILYTLPEKQREILTLYFGLKDNHPRDTIEIASMYGLTKSRISAIINKALETIRTTIRVKYLEEVYETSSIINYDIYDKKLEEILILNLPKDMIDKLISKLNTQREVRIIQLCYENPEYNLKTLSEKLNCSLPYAQKTKENAIENIRKTIMTYLKENQIDVTYENYINYLMQLYLNNQKVRRREKK